MMPNKPSSRWAILRGNIGVMLLSSGLWNLAGAMTWPFWALYVLELGGSHLDIGLISALGAVSRILPTLLGGYIADRVGRKRILYSMSFLVAFNELLIAVAPSYRFLYLTAFLEALFHGFRDPAFSSIIADSTNPNNRALTLSLWQVVPPLFGLASPYAIGLVMDARGVLVAMRWAYIFTFFMGLAASLLRYWYIEETLTEIEPRTNGTRKTLGDMLGDFRETFRALPRQLWIFLVIDFIFTLGWAVSEPYFVTYATEVGGLTSAQWGLIITLSILVRTAIKPPSAVASDRYGRLKFIFPCMIMWPVFFFMFGNSMGFTAVMLSRLAIAFTGSLADPAWEALFVDYAPKEYRGRFSAIASVSWSLIWGGGVAMGGAIYEGYSKRTPFNVTTALFVIGTLVAVLVLKEPEKRES